MKKRVVCVPLLLLTACPMPAEASAVHQLWEQQSVAATNTEMSEPWQYFHLVCHIGCKKDRDCQHNLLTCQDYTKEPIKKNCWQSDLRKVQNSSQEPGIAKRFPGKNDWPLERGQKITNRRGSKHYLFPAQHTVVFKCLNLQNCIFVER